MDIVDSLLRGLLNGIIYYIIMTIFGYELCKKKGKKRN